MILVQDTREQTPLDFKDIEGIEKIEEVGLPYGDYTAICHGCPVPIVFERKGFGDLWGTMTSGHDRFKRELQRAKDDNVKLILIIEGSYTDVWNGFERSKVDGQTMLKKLATMYVKYDLEYIFCESRRVMARRIVDTFLAVERNFSKASS